MTDGKKTQLKKIIQEEVFVSAQDERIPESNPENGWLYDFRRILMNGHTANLVSDIFYEEFKDEYPFQLGALEIAGVPLVTSLMNKLYVRGHTDINAFFIRKSRKKTGLLRMIEGEVHDQPKKIVLVDDLINSGKSFWRQIAVLRELGYEVDTVWTILRFRDQNYYRQFEDQGIKVHSLFCLDDFEGMNNKVDTPKTPTATPFSAQWVFRAKQPSLEHVVPKSQPVCDEDTIYMGSDTGYVHAIEQATGKVHWSYKIGYHIKNKGVFSGPQLYKNLVIFGGYDGNIYALDKATGKRVWVNMTADWVGSTPALNHKDGIVYCGLEFGLVQRQGGVIAIDANSGKTIWLDQSHQALTHASPLYIPQTNEVVIGSNEGVVYMYDAKNGKLKWTQKTYGGADYSWSKDRGFGDGSIKMQPAYDAQYDYIVVASIDSFLYILERKTGKIVHHHKAAFACWGSPVVHRGFTYWTSLDKKVRCLNLDKLTLEWELVPDNTRIFSSPTIINDLLYVGTNAGRLHEIDPANGEITAYFQAKERITNCLIYNPKNETYFLPTYANELIALRKSSSH